MGWRGTIRSVQASIRAAERDALRRQRELEKRHKELAKANELQQAFYEVETYKNRLDQLISVHKEGSQAINWKEESGAPDPSPPILSSTLEAAARLKSDLYKPGFLTWLLRKEEKEREALSHQIEMGREQDRDNYRKLVDQYSREKKESEESRKFAQRILSGDLTAYLEAIKDLNPFGEINDLGSRINIKPISPLIVLAELDVRGEAVLPRETKTLLKSGKLSTKPTPKSDFYRLYQDYICSCVLRVARELLALLPVESVVVTALDDLLNTSTGHVEECPILSVFIPRKSLARLNFDQIDPSDSMKNFVHQMDFQAATGFRAVNRVSLEGLQH